MSKMDVEDFSDLSILELFRMEVETQSTVLTEGLLGLERDADSTQRLEELMRAAHSLKGAARIVGRQTAVRVAHAMEECFVAAQEKKRTISGELINMGSKSTEGDRSVPSLLLFSGRGSSAAQPGVCRSASGLA